MKDGIYLEVFAVKDGERLNYKTISLEDMTQKITLGLCDGIGKAIEPECVDQECAIGRGGR